MPSTRARREAVLLYCGFRGDDQRGRAVVDAGRVAGGHRSIFSERRLQLGELLDRGVGARVFIMIDQHRAFLAAGRLNRHDLGGEIAVAFRLAGAHLRAECKCVLIGTADLEFLRHVLSRFRHGIDAVLALHQRIDETPADCRVENLDLARKGGVGLALDEGRARHRFDAASNGEVHLAGLDSARGGADRLHARCTKTVKRHARHAVGQPRQEQRHARDVAVVLAGLVGAAEEHVVELFPVDMGVALPQRADRHRGEVVGAHIGERAAEAADRRARRVADEDFTHVCHHAASAVARAVRACSSRSTASSCAVGGGVSSTFAAYFTGQPVFS